MPHTGCRHNYPAGVRFQGAVEKDTDLRQTAMDIY